MKQSISRTLRKTLFLKSLIEPILSSQTAVKSLLFPILETIRRLVPNWPSNGFWEIFWGQLGTSPLANFFFLSLVTVPEVFAKVNSAQFPSRL